MIKALHQFVPTLAAVGRLEQLVGNNDKHCAVGGVVWRENQGVDGIVRIVSAQVLDVDKPDRYDDRQNEQAGDAYSLPTQASLARWWVSLGCLLFLGHSRVGSAGHTLAFLSPLGA